MGYHGHEGLLSVTDVPYRTPIATAFVNAGSQIGLPVIDVNGQRQVGINYLQVNDDFRLTAIISFVRDREIINVQQNSLLVTIVLYISYDFVC